jgi:catechol 2,3-dioxygenase-like lactoylglutathione lyase family enzyme
VPGGPRCLFDHVRLPVRDIARSRAFYERALQPFGVRVVESRGPASRSTIAKTSGSWNRKWRPVRCTLRSPRHRETVDAFHAAAIEAGGVDNGRLSGQSSGLLIRGSQVRILPGALGKPPETGVFRQKGRHRGPGGNRGGNKDLARLGQPSAGVHDVRVPGRAVRRPARGATNMSRVANGSEQLRLNREMEHMLAKDAARRKRRAEKQRRRREELTEKQRIDAWVDRGYGRRL